MWARHASPLRIGGLENPLFLFEYFVLDVVINRTFLRRIVLGT